MYLGLRTVSTCTYTLMFKRREIEVILHVHLKVLSSLHDILDIEGFSIDHPSQELVSYI